MQLGEAVLMAVADDERHDPQICLFCAAAPRPVEGTNDLTAAADEDTDFDAPQPTVRNDSAALARALIAVGEPQPTYTVWLVARGERRRFAVTTAAHHLIPGHGALTRSTLCKAGKYLRTAGTGRGNIGYDVNAAENGAWLPGNYAQRPWGQGGAVFAATHGVTPDAYATAAMAVGGQFHDAHAAYSDFVCRGLDRIADKLDLSRTECPEIPPGSESGNLHGLIFRLHRVSARLRRMLVHPGSNRGIAQCWRRNIVTSRFVPGFVATLAEEADA